MFLELDTPRTYWQFNHCHRAWIWPMTQGLSQKQWKDFPFFNHQKGTKILMEWSPERFFEPLRLDGSQVAPPKQWGHRRGERKNGMVVDFFRISERAVWRCWRFNFCMEIYTSSLRKLRTWWQILANQQWLRSSYRHWGPSPAGLSVFRECPYIGSHLRREGPCPRQTVAGKI